MPTFYTYLHCDPVSMVPFYVGKGHKNRARSLACRNDHHLVKIAKLGGIDKIKVLYYYAKSEQIAFDFEKELIYILKNLCGLKLCNQTNGGDGSSGYMFTPEDCEKVSKGMMGREFTLEHRKNLSLARLGYTMPEETKDLLSSIFIGVKKPPRSKEHTKNLKKSRQELIASGWKMPEASISQMANKLRGRTRDPVASEKAAQKRRGRKNSPEAVERQRTAAKKRCCRQAIERLIKEFLSQDIQYRPRPAFKAEVLRRQ